MLLEERPGREETEEGEDAAEEGNAVLIHRRRLHVRGLVREGKDPGLEEDLARCWLDAYAV